MAFAKTLEDKWTALGLNKSQFAGKDNSPRSNGQLVIHKTGTFLSGTLFDIFCMLYVDDGAFFWIQDRHRKRDHPPHWLICLVWTRNSHWNKTNPSNTECVLFSSPGFFNAWTIPLNYINNSTLDLQKKENKKIGAHVRIKNIPSADKQRSSK